MGVDRFRVDSDYKKATSDLYVTNLPKSTTELDLLDMFGPYGEIVLGELLVDRWAFLPTSVALIRFKKREQAARAMAALDKYVPKGADKPIRIRQLGYDGKQRHDYHGGF